MDNSVWKGRSDCKDSRFKCPIFFHDSPLPVIHFNHLAPVTQSLDLGSGHFSPKPDMTRPRVLTMPGLLIFIPFSKK